jgi:hypothetical protein
MKLLSRSAPGMAKALLLFIPWLALPDAVSARTWLIPHVLETSGRTTVQPYAFDTQLTVTVVTPETATSDEPVSVELYLYENLGQPMNGWAGEVCHPCLIELSGNTRQTNIIVGDLIDSNGGGFNTPVKLGFAVIQHHAGDADRVVVEGRVVNSLATPLNLSVFNFKPAEIRDEGSSPRTLVLPHFLEKQGTLVNSTFTFDTSIHMAYTPSRPDGASATVDLFLYNDDGTPLQSQSGTAVCQPCQFHLNTFPSRKVSANLEDLIQTAGGFDAPVKSGFGIVVVGGQDPGGVALQAFVMNAKTTPFDVSIFGYEPASLSGPATNSSRAFALPHVLESNGKTTEPNQFDTVLVATYAGGLAGISNQGGAQLSLYLYDNLGQPMRGAGFTPVCDPCTFTLSESNRKQTIVVDDLIVAAGGFDLPVKLGFGVVVVDGADPDTVTLQGFVINSHTGPFDLSVFAFEPPPIAANPLTEPSLNRAFVFPHVLEKSGRTTIGNNALDTLFYITFATSPANPLSGRTVVELYLFDPDGGPLRGASRAVCAPCSYNLDGPNQQLSILLDDLILQAGGFDTPVKTGHAVVLVSGAHPDAVNVQGLVLNSHTSPFDASVFGFQPHELKTPPRVLPKLWVSRLANQVLLRWSVSSPGYALERNDVLSKQWEPTVIQPVIVGREYHVTNNIGPANAFFRLRSTAGAALTD